RLSSDLQQVGPCRVAMHAQQGAGRCQAAARELGTVVQQVPAAHGAGLIRGGGGSHIDFARPFGVDAGPVGGYQTISTMAGFRPEPTPTHSTRSPAARVCASAARVMGREAGPTLPQCGNVIGTLSGSRSMALMMARVYALLTWCVT